MNEEQVLRGLDSYLTRENDPGTIEGTPEPVVFWCQQCDCKVSLHEISLHWVQGHIVETSKTRRIRLYEQHKAAQADPRRS